MYAGEWMRISKRIEIIANVHFVLVRDSALGDYEDDEMSELLTRYCVYDVLWSVGVCQHM